MHCVGKPHRLPGAVHRSRFPRWKGSETVGPVHGNREVRRLPEAAPRGLANAAERAKEPEWAAGSRFLKKRPGRPAGSAGGRASGAARPATLGTNAILYAFDAGTGKELFRSELDSFNHFTNPVVAGGTVVNDFELKFRVAFVIILGPGLEIRREFVVGHNVNRFQIGNAREIVDQPFDNWFAADHEQRLRLVQRQRVQASGVSGSENKNVHEIK